ncbi:MAG: ParB/RepB/Spo0J family partition protein [Gemmatimonadetes bacterium]|nr:ParB/RepB/Spo0J family partition protein [Gemmatimonadota bacterium]
MSTEKPRRLGRGLEALLGRAAAPTREAPRDGAAAAAAPAPVETRGTPLTLAITAIRPNPFQPRREFKPEELAELEASLKANGLLQPVTVRPVAGQAGRYELVAGERRLRAAARLGWTEIPALVREFDDRAMLTLALVENLQRADLNAIDEATGVRRLIDEFGLTQQQVADALGKDRSTIANLIRVLALPAGVQTLISTGQLSLGHARALLTVADTRLLVQLARQAVDEGWSVREVERRSREATTRQPTKGGRPSREASASAGPGGGSSAAVREASDALRKYLQTPAAIQMDGAGKGTITLNFYSSEDLQRLLELILRARWSVE